jgi:hypothetical protein
VARGVKDFDPALIAQIKTMRQNGYTQRRIVDELNREGVPNPLGQKWHLTSIQSVLKLEDVDPGRARVVLPSAAHVGAKDAPKEILGTEYHEICDIRSLDLPPREELEPKSPQARGAINRHNRRRLLEGIGLAELEQDHKAAPYHLAATDLLDRNKAMFLAEYGFISPAAMICLQNASNAYAKCRYWQDYGYMYPDNSLGTDLLADKLATSCEQHLEKAHKFAARDYAARKKDDKKDPFADLLTAAADDD